MSSTSIRMPSLGESLVEGTVGKWLVHVGQRIDRDQPVVEILTDKADSEVPSPEAGVVTKILVNEGDVIKVGDVLCEIDPAATAATSAPLTEKPRPAAERPQPVAERPRPASASNTQAIAALSTTDAGNGHPVESLKPAAAVPSAVPPAMTRPELLSPSSPSVRKLAREQGVDLQQLSGSGEGGRVTRDDVLRAATPAEPAVRPVAPSPGRPAPAALVGQVGSGAFRVPPYVQRSGDEVVPFTRRRRIIADHMVYSKLTAPHVVTFAECDLYKTDKLRKQHKERLKSEGVNLTMLSFVAAATTRALREHRNMNARMLEDSYVLLGEINLGIAVDTAEGLIVPVVRHADELTVRGLARAIDALAQKARESTLTPDDLAGKSFTISNPGRMGNLVGGAIISQPNVGILRIGEIKKRVVVIEHEDEDLMAIHPVMYLALSYDHRVVDGVGANGFLHRVVELLEQADFGL
jgi:2-oxoglutarate dehydrogenase E2 component (dihydrolipoamide succinyltransferase)